MQAILRCEELEQRDLANASVALVNGVLGVADDSQGSVLTVAQKTLNNVAVVEVFNATNGGVADFNANQVASIAFQGGAGGGSFTNLTSLPSTQKAANNPATVQVLVGGSTADVLDASAA